MPSLIGVAGEMVDFPWDPFPIVEFPVVKTVPVRYEFVSEVFGLLSVVFADRGGRGWECSLDVCWSSSDFGSMSMLDSDCRFFVRLVSGL